LVPLLALICFCRPHVKILFQNEHISKSGDSIDQRVCRLCLYIAPDYLAVRRHLVTKHSIDLESPGACLVEPETSSSSSRESSSNVTVKSEDLISSSSVSPERTTSGRGRSAEQERAKDLTTKGKKGKCDARKRIPSPKYGKMLRSINNNASVHQAPFQEWDANWQCQHCSISFPNPTLYFLHKGFHSDNNPWRCNGCGIHCADLYDFNTHLMSDPHK